MDITDGNELDVSAKAADVTVDIVVDRMFLQGDINASGGSGVVVKLAADNLL